MNEEQETNPKEVIEMPQRQYPRDVTAPVLTSGGEASDPLAAAQRPTPRTDKWQSNWDDTREVLSAVEEMQKMERELAEAREKIAAQAEQIERLLSLVRMAYEWGVNGVKGYDARYARSFQDHAATILTEALASHPAPEVRDKCDCGEKIAWDPDGVGTCYGCGGRFLRADSTQPAKIRGAGGR
jgi:hypothetical protein